MRYMIVAKNSVAPWVVVLWILIGSCVWAIPVWAQNSTSDGVIATDNIQQQADDRIAQKKKQERATLCLEFATTPMEKAYCQIQAADPSIRLPLFSDFRRNPAAMQALLLKKPAKKAGIVLPKVSTQKKPPQKVGRPGAKVVRNNSNTIQPKSEPVINTELNGCELKPKSITCAEQVFTLQLNLNNSKIPEQALEEANLLGFPIEPEFILSETEKRRYLWRCYQVYIDKMHEIGLSASTVPFTKFYYMYEEGKSQKVLFHERFEKTFKFLKRDKKNLAVRASYSLEIPQNLDQCLVLTRDYIVCDKKAANWVYKRSR